MKNILLLLACLLILSCGGKNTSGQTDLPKSKVNPTVTTNFKTLDTTVSFSGFWVNASYVENIKRTKSAKQSQIYDESCIVIPPKTLIVTNMVWGFHDGGSEWVLVKNGENYQFWSSYLEKKIADVKILNSNEIKIGDKVFVKITGTEHQLTLSEPTILEEILFKGKYKLEGGSTVEFKGDGKVVGLPDFSYYSAELTFNEPGMDIDQIAGGKSKNEASAFAYKFNKDTLSIFKVKCINFNKEDNYCETVDFGDLVYQLVKIN